METITKILIGVAVGATALVGYGLYESSKASAATTPSGLPPIGEGIVLTPGAMTMISLPLSSPTLTFVAPASTTDMAHGGGEITSATSSDTTVLASGSGASGIIGTPVVKGSATWHAATAGSATLTIQWQDALGNAYTSTIPISVTSTAVPMPGPVAAVSAPLPYNMATSLDGGHTYLASTVLTTGTTFAQDLAKYGVTINQTWQPGQVPSNWPGTDIDPTRTRVSFTMPGAAGDPLVSYPLSIPIATITALIPGVTVFSTGA